MNIHRAQVLVKIFCGDQAFGQRTGTDENKTHTHTKKERKKERDNPIYFNTNHCRKMKLVPIIMDYSLL